MTYKVKEVANLVGVSVRTLHHYDEIGLLKAAFVNEAGYRFYNDSSLERLQQILFFKELGFGLEQVKQILDAPGFNRKQALQNHKNLLLKQKQRLEELIQTVETTLKSLDHKQGIQPQELFKGFDMQEIEAHKQKYAQEVEERWGHTDAYKESQLKTSKYKQEDWERIQADSDEIYQRMINHMEQNLGPESPAMQQVVAALRAHFTQFFYNCTPQIFRGLGQMYVQDERFKAFYENLKPGLADYLSQGIEIYCNGLEK